VKYSGWSKNNIEIQAALYVPSGSFALEQVIGLLALRLRAGKALLLRSVAFHNLVARHTAIPSLPLLETLTRSLLPLLPRFLSSTLQHLIMNSLKNIHTDQDGR
jgi:hypothetical protein